MLTHKIPAPPNDNRSHILIKEKVAFVSEIPLRTFRMAVMFLRAVNTNIWPHNKKVTETMPSTTKVFSIGYKKQKQLKSAKQPIHISDNIRYFFYIHYNNRRRYQCFAESFYIDSNQL